MSLEIIHIALRTGYSFKNTFGHITETCKYAVDGIVGIADIENTFSHPALEMHLKKSKSYIKPLYGVRLPVVKDASERIPPRGQFGAEYIFLAKNIKGLTEIYNLIKINSRNFYYRGNISLHDVYKLSTNVIVIAEYFHYAKRIDYIGLSPRTPQYILEDNPDIPRVALVDNNYPRPKDKQVYELLTAPNTSNRTTPQYILTTNEWKTFMKNRGEDLEAAIKNTHHIAKELCEPIKLRKAPTMRATEGYDLDYLCEIGAKKRKIDLTKGKYKERYEYELALIKEKDFADYFIVVSDIVRWAKKRMLVGPARGSSGGSLICYLCDITELDPLKFDLIFERFIDINRSDLPDIDIDFPDDKRPMILKYLKGKYGNDNVKQVAIVSTMQPKVSIVEFAKGLRIPSFETTILKNAIIKRSGGDARASMCLQDTFETTDAGKEFIRKYPQMSLTAMVEEHPRHSGVHAAGIVVCNENISLFCGTRERDKEDIVMTEKNGAEHLNLLKIDVLGLRTLSILADFANQSKIDHKFFYTIDLDDEKTFSIFNEGRVQGIFQFEGSSVAGLTKRMGVSSFEDIIALTSLARPGALYSGGASRYIKYRTGEEEPVFVGPIHQEITGNSYGCVVYQEQMLRICREMGGMEWEDVNALRRALSKSYGKEFFMKYKDKFMAGILLNGYSEEDGEFLWAEIENGGAYAFNRSHAVGYALISYWCAWAKAHHPLEFLVANLNNSKDPESALKILRDAVRNEGIKYCPIDVDDSELYWSHKNGIVLGGLTNISGIGVSKARQIIAARDGEGKLSKSMINKLMSPKTDFDVLFPAQHFWGDIYKDPRKYELKRKVSEIINVNGQGNYIFIGKLKMKNLRDLNEYVNLVKRGGKVLDKDNLTISILVEDDTDTIMCSVNRFKYEKMGKEIAESGIVGETWYIIDGTIKHDSRFIDINQIAELTHDSLED